LNGHLDYAVDSAVGCDAHDTSAKKSAVPEIPFGVDSGAIRQAAREIPQKGGLSHDIAGAWMIVVRPHRVGQRISKIETPVVGTPGQSVRDAKIFPVNRDSTIRIEAIENPILASSLAA